MVVCLQPLKYSFLLLTFSEKRQKTQEAGRGGVLACAFWLGPYMPVGARVHGLRISCHQLSLLVSAHYTENS